MCAALSAARADPAKAEKVVGAGLQMYADKVVSAKERPAASTEAAYGPLLAAATQAQVEGWCIFLRVLLLFLSFNSLLLRSVCNPRPAADTYQGF
jgi:hypothetical protein